MARINALAAAPEPASPADRPAPPPAAAVLPMDGFHLYRRELDALPDPQVTGG